MELEHCAIDDSVVLVYIKDLMRLHPGPVSSSQGWKFAEQSCKTSIHRSLGSYSLMRWTGLIPE